MSSTPLFTQYEIPWISSLTAGQYDASTSFDANMPASHMLYSLAVLNSYQSQGPTKEPDILGMPEVPGRQPKEITEAQGADPKKVPENLLTGPNSLSEIFSSDKFKDYAKRFGLVIFAALLILLAIYRMK
jgi:hypothetical protein